jgi:hypothetical protein
VHASTSVARGKRNLLNNSSLAFTRSLRVVTTETWKDEMIRDRIVVGIRGTALSQKLQLDAALSLEKAKTMVRQREAVQDQQAQMETRFKTKGLVETVKHKSSQWKGKFNPAASRPQSTGSKGPYSKLPNRCFRCGKELAINFQ